MAWECDWCGHWQETPWEAAVVVIVLLEEGVLEPEGWCSICCGEAARFYGVRVA